MKVDPDLSVYHEADEAPAEFSQAEIEKLRLLLRRLRFLEKQVRENGGLTGGGGSAWAELEMHATAWILDEVGYLRERAA